MTPLLCTALAVDIAMKILLLPSLLSYIDLKTMTSVCSIHNFTFSTWLGPKDPRLYRASTITGHTAYFTKRTRHLKMHILQFFLH